MEIVVAFAVGLLVLGVLLKLISLPFRIIKWFVTNSIMGAIMLAIVNLFGVGLEITFLKALVAGVLGIPGVIVITIMHFL